MVFILNLLDSLVPQSANTPLLLDIIFYINLLATELLFSANIIQRLYRRFRRNNDCDVRTSVVEKDCSIMGAGLDRYFQYLVDLPLYISKPNKMLIVANINPCLRSCMSSGEKSLHFQKFSNIEDARRGSIYDTPETHSFMTGLKTNEVNCKITKLSFQVNRLRKRLQVISST